jgi:hypothetical protein
METKKCKEGQKAIPQVTKANIIQKNVLCHLFSLLCNGAIYSRQKCHKCKEYFFFPRNK